MYIVALVVGLVGAGIGIVLVVAVFDAKRQSQEKLAKLAAVCIRRGKRDAATLNTDTDFNDAAEDAIRGVNVLEKNPSGAMGEFISLAGVVAMLIVGVIGLAGLIWAPEVDKLQTALNSDVRQKAKKEGTKFESLKDLSDWTASMFIETQKDGLTVKKDIPDGFTLYVNDTKSGVWKSLPGEGFYSLDQLGWAKAPTRLQIFFSYSGKVEIPTVADSRVKQLPWTIAVAKTEEKKSEEKKK